jgi:hypothetical protein
MLMKILGSTKKNFFQIQMPSHNIANLFFLKMEMCPSRNLPIFSASIFKGICVREEDFWYILQQSYLHYYFPNNAQL